jgi:hypothetical protein
MRDNYDYMTKSSYTPASSSFRTDDQWDYASPYDQGPSV